MSQENVEIIRRWFAPLGEGPQEISAGVSELCDANVDYYPVRKFPEARPCHGRDELTEFFIQFGDAFAHSEWVIRRIIDVGCDRVLACVNLQAAGRGSGLELQGDVFICFWLRHGRVFREEDHLTLAGALNALGFEAETLEAAGLSE